MKKIFIIDDEEPILNMLKKSLSRSEKFSVTTFVNPIEGLNAIKTSKPDLVLLDIMMPQMGGIEVLEKIKEIDKSINVVMMTAYSTLDKVLKTHTKGAENYILKPFESMNVVEEKILKSLGM